MPLDKAVVAGRAKARPALSLQRLKEVLRYDAETGQFHRLVGIPGQSAGAIVGSRHKANGYVYITIDREKHLAHRLAWFYVHGEWPPEQIDHRNGIKHENRIGDLRCATPRLNNENHLHVRADNTTGKTGVGPTSSGRPFRARIYVEGREIHLGRFDSIDEASSIYLRAKRELHQGCTV